MTDTIIADRDQLLNPDQSQGSVLRTTERGQFALQLQRVMPSLLELQPVSLAYLFGSAATGQTTSLSDVDIALVTDSSLSSLARRKLILRIQLDLHDQAGLQNADVRIINDAPLVFRGRVVTDGILVYARSDQERVEFETMTRLRYFDYLPVHRAMQDAFFADLQERGLHG